MPPTVTAFPLFDWVALASLLAFLSMGLDKMLAVGKRSRVGERTLWLTALAGGFPGIFVGAFVFHHKTSKPEFWWPVVVALALWATFLVILTRPLPL